MSGLLIHVLGIDGSGKTTLVKQLEKCYKNDMLYVQPFSQPYFTNELHNIANRLNMSRRMAFSQQLRSLVWMLDLIKTTNEILIPNIKKGIDVIVDRYALCSCVYMEVLTHNNMCYMEQILSNLPSPNFGLYLDVSIEEAFQRIQLRNKDIAPYEKLDMLKNLKEKYEELIKVAKYPIHKLNANENEEKVFSEAIYYINKYKGEKRDEGIKY